MKKNKYLYLPVEMKVRELDGKMLLIAQALQKGQSVVIGRKSELCSIIKDLPIGLFFGIWAQQNFLSLYQSLKEKGHVTAVMDEEGLVTFSDEIYRGFRLYADTLKQIDHFFTWGQYHENMCKPVTDQSPDMAVYNTGNLRFDLLRPEYKHIYDEKVQQLKSKHGRYVLINSSFSFCNHVSGKDEYFEALKKSGVIQAQSDEDFLLAYRNLQERVLAELLKALPSICKAFPDINFIIRPHPGEDSTIWAEAIEGLSNIQIIFDGDVHPWILGSEAVIHHFCTTALEAYAAGVPSIAFRSEKDSILETELPYWGSIEAATGDEMIAHLQDIITGNHTNIKQRRDEAAPKLNQYIENIESIAACEKMSTIFADVTPETSESINSSDFLIPNLKDFVRSLLNHFSSDKNSPENTYINHKCPHIHKNDLHKPLSKILPAEKMSRLKIRKLTKNCFLLSCKD